MTEPTSAVTAVTTAIDNAAKVANTPLFTTVIDKVTGFKISQWAAEGEVWKKLIHDEYEKAKEQGIIGVQYIALLRQTTNLINTAVKSAKYIDAGKPNEIKMDNDFFWNTIEHSKSVSNEEMQELIARIIAGEYNEPGTYAMSTLQAIKMLGKNELELFENMCCLLINQSRIPSTLFKKSDSSMEILREFRMNFGHLQILQNLGLFLPNSMVQTFENLENKNVELQYYDKQIVYKPKNENVLEFETPSYYGLSITGAQIAKHLNHKFNDEYFKWLKENYKIDNYVLKE